MLQTIITIRLWHNWSILFVTTVLLNTCFALKNRILQQQVIQGPQKIMEQLMKEYNENASE
jgi:hypothetical protein